MSDIDPKILGKIKKCLALAGSSNPNEAATALRQAHALMEKYGVSTHEITMADIGQSKTESKTMARDKPAHWETRLAAIVGKAFGCQIMVHRSVLQAGKGHLNEGSFVFVGLKAQAEVAAYTASVLIRKCKAARTAWLSENFLGIGSGVKGAKTKKTRMGDMFAEGWVETISGLVAEFANPPGVESAIEQYIDSESSGKEAPTRSVLKSDVGRFEHAAIAMGMKAAQGERLFRPMEKGASPLAIGMHHPMKNAAAN